MRTFPYHSLAIHMHTPEEISEMSDGDLEKYLDSSAFGSMNRHLALEELTRRRLRSISKPHWTLTPAFWVIVATMIFAAIAAWPVIRGFFETSPPVSKAASSLQQQPPSTPSPLTTSHESPYSNHRSDYPNPRLDTDRQKTPTGQP